MIAPRLQRIEHVHTDDQAIHYLAAGVNEIAARVNEIIDVVNGLASLADITAEAVHESIGRITQIEDFLVPDSSPWQIEGTDE